MRDIKKVIEELTTKTLMQLADKVWLHPDRYNNYHTITLQDTRVNGDEATSVLAFKMAGQRLANVLEIYACEVKEVIDGIELSSLTVSVDIFGYGSMGSSTYDIYGSDFKVDPTWDVDDINEEELDLLLNEILRDDE